MLKVLSALFVLLVSSLPFNETSGASLPPPPPIPPVPGFSSATDHNHPDSVPSMTIDASHTWLSISTIPPGASVFLDGFLVGQTPVGRRVRSGDNVNLRIEMVGFYPQVYTATLVGGQEFRLNFPLARIPVPPKPYAP